MGFPPRSVRPFHAALLAPAALCLWVCSKPIETDYLAETAPVITAQPRDTTVAAGASGALFLVTATGALSYQWVRDESDTLPGQVLAGLLLSDVGAEDDSTTYKCVVRNLAGSVVTRAARLRVIVASQAIAAPTVPPGGTATLTVSAPGAVSYQWVRGTSDTLAGKTSATLVLPGVGEAQDGTTYTVIVRYGDGSTKGHSTTLTVAVPRAVLIDTGESIHQGYCTGCHGIAGRGHPGSVPPHANADFFMANRRKAIEIVLRGYSDSLFVNGMWYDGEMPAYGTFMTNTEIAGILTYLRAVRNDSTVVSCSPYNPNDSTTYDGEGFARCVKVPRSFADRNADSVSLREVRLVRDSMFP